MIRGTDRWIWEMFNQVGRIKLVNFYTRFKPPFPNPEKPSNHTTVISPTGVANLVGQRSYLCWKRLGDLAGGNKINWFLKQVGCLNTSSFQLVSNCLKKTSFHEVTKMWSGDIFPSQKISAPLFSRFLQLGLRLLFGCKHTLEAKGTKQRGASLLELHWVLLRFFGKASSAPAACETVEH